MEVKRTWKRAIAFMLALVMAFCFMPSVPAMAMPAVVSLTTTDTGFTYGKAGSVYFATNQYDNKSEFVHFAIGDEAAAAKGITASLKSVSMDNAEIVINFTKNTPAGTYKFYLTPYSESVNEISDDDYNYQAFIGSFTIAKRDVEVTIADTETPIVKSYGDELLGEDIDYTIEDVSSAESDLSDDELKAAFNLTFSSEGFPANAAVRDQEYDITASYDSVSFNVVQESNLSALPKIKVVKRALNSETDSVSITSKIYDKDTEYSTDDLEKSVVIGALTGIDNTYISANFTLAFDTGVTPKNAGDYTVTLTARENTNFTGSLTGKFTITPKGLTEENVTLSGTPLTYNEGEQSPTVTVNDGTSTLVEGTDYEVTENTQTVVGEYTVKVEGKNNYTGTVTKGTWSIEKADLEVGGVTLYRPDGWVYGETSSEKPRLDGWTEKDGTSVHYYYQKLNDDNQTWGAYEEWTDSTNTASFAAGTYRVYAVISGDNYNKKTIGRSETEYDAQNDETFKVTPKPVDLVIGNAEGLYKITPDLAEVSINYYESSDDVDYDYSGDTPIDATFENVSRANLTADSATGGNIGFDTTDATAPEVVGQVDTTGNYKIEKVVPGEYKVKAHSLESGHADVLMHGGNATYDAQVHKPTFTVQLINLNADQTTETLTPDIDYTITYYQVKQGKTVPEILDSTVDVDSIFEKVENQEPKNAGTYYVKIAATDEATTIKDAVWDTFDIAKGTITVKYPLVTKTYVADDTEVDLTGVTPVIVVDPENTQFDSSFVDINTETIKGKVAEADNSAGVKPIIFYYEDGDTAVEMDANRKLNGAFDKEIVANYDVVFAEADLEATTPVNAVKITTDTLVVEAKIAGWVYDKGSDETTHNNIPTVTVWANNKDITKDVTVQYALKKEGEYNFSEFGDWATVARNTTFDAGYYYLKVKIPAVTGKYNEIETDEISFRVYPQALIVIPDDVEKTYLDREIFTYKVYTADRDNNGSVNPGSKELVEDPSVYFNSISVGRTEKSEDVGTHYIDKCIYSLKDKTNYEVYGVDRYTNKLSYEFYGKLIINKLNLSKAKEEGKLVLVVNDAGAYPIVGEDTVKGYLYDGRAHKPQITKQDVQQSWNNSSKVKVQLAYQTIAIDGTERLVVVPDSDFVITYNNDKDVQVENPTNVGTYFVTVGPSNSTDNVEGKCKYYEFRVLPAVYYVTYGNAASPVTKTYNATTEFTLPAITKVELGNDDLSREREDITTTYSFTGAPTKGKTKAANAGTYTFDKSQISIDMSGVKVDGKTQKEANNNFAIEVVSIPNVVINPKTLTLSGSVSLKDRPYDATLKMDVNNTLKLVGVESVDNGKVNISGVAKSVTLAAAQGANVGDKTYTFNLALSGSAKNNYKLKTTSITAKGKINKKDVTVASTLALKDKAYDGTKTMTVTGAVTASGLIASDGTKLTGAEAKSVTVANANAGDKSYTFKLALSGNAKDNYNLKTTSVTAKGKINKKDVTVTSTLALKDKTYDGTKTMAVTGTATASGLIASDGTKLTGAEAKSVTVANANAGDKSYTFKLALSGNAKDNYNLKTTSVTAKGKINPVVEEVKTVDMLRLYNPNTGEHFFTASVSEKNNLVSAGWKYEGIGWKAPATSNTPVYRLYDKNTGDHHYTTNVTERDNLVKLGWKNEGIGWYSDDNKSVPLYRQYNPNATTGAHNYTTSKAENDRLISLGWKEEGIGWYGVK